MPRGAYNAGVPDRNPQLRQGVRRVAEGAQQADYALDTDVYQKYEILGYIVSAEVAIAGFEGADVGAKRSFAAHALFRQRLL